MDENMLLILWWVTSRLFCQLLSIDIAVFCRVRDGAGLHQRGPEEEAGGGLAEVRAVLRDHHHSGGRQVGGRGRGWLPDSASGWAVLQCQHARWVYHKINQVELQLWRGRYHKEIRKWRSVFNSLRNWRLWIRMAAYLTLIWVIS